MTGAGQESSASDRPSDSFHEEEPPRVAIVVLNWNNYEDTAACLRSLSDVTYPSMNVYFADNGSTDSSGERLSTEFPAHEFVFNGENLGFAAGCNPAINRALDNGADYVLLLNNDARVDSDFLTPLVQTAETNDQVAAVGGVIYDESGDIWSAGGQFHPTFTVLRHRATPEDGVYETEFISGAMILLSAEFLAEVGGLNESYFFGMEDEELAWEARRRGWKLLINPDSEAVHDGGGSAAEGSSFRYYHDTRNRLTFATSNLPPLRLAAFAVFFTVTRLIRFVQWTLRGQQGYVKATALAVADQLTNAEHRLLDDFEG